jgi:hypothetical protein
MAPAANVIASAANTFLDRSPWPATAVPTPVLTVVVDTEGEFDWSAPFDPAARAVTNIAHQPLAQAILDRHGVVPTYTVDHPVATTPEAIAVLRGFADSGRCEIGAHLHPWVNPPAGETISDRNSFPGNLPAELERAKLAALTDAIAAGFGRRPTIYKAGRNGIGPATAGILRELGYRIDVSIVPHYDYSAGAGPDFTGFPAHPFRVGAGLTAVPLSVGFAGPLAGLGSAIYPVIAGPVGLGLRLPGIAARLGLLERIRLSPEGQSLDELRRLTKSGLRQGQRLFMLTYHSSSLLPGATDYVRDETERRAFLATLDAYLAFFMGECGGRPAGISEIVGAANDLGAPLQQAV